MQNARLVVDSPLTTDKVRATLLKALRDNIFLPSQKHCCKEMVKMASHSLLSMRSATCDDAITDRVVSTVMRSLSIIYDTVQVANTMVMSCNIVFEHSGYQER